MQLDAEGLAVQQAAETARREAGKLGMRVLQQQMQVSHETWQADSHALLPANNSIVQEGGIMEDACCTGVLMQWKQAGCVSS